MGNYTEVVFEEYEQPGQSAVAARRRPYRPPIGIPEPVRESRWTGSVASVVLHAIILLLVLAPIFASDVVNEILNQGAGGPGPAGGGGGGRGGSGGAQTTERLRFFQVAPPPPAPTPAEIPPVVPPPKEEVVQPIAPPKIEIKTELPSTDKIDMALTAGLGGGTGRDGSNGSGPGSGGGVGSGIGTGRGSGTGPGTGGGEGTIYPPIPIAAFMAPFPIPERIKPYHMVAVFDVDEKGNVVSVEFNPSRDGSYNKRLKAQLAEFR